MQLDIMVTVCYLTPLSPPPPLSPFPFHPPPVPPPVTDIQVHMH